MSTSASQCHNCRKRRVRCDSAQPTCRKCALKGIECLGYGKQKPLVWLQDGGYQNQYLSEGNKPASQRKPRKSGRPRLVVAKDENQTTESALIQTNPPTDEAQCTTFHIPENLDLKYPMDINIVVSSLWYFYERIYPDINPFLHYRTLPALDVQSWQDDFTNLYLHIIVSISATHKAVQSRQQGSAVCLSREVYQYRSYALRRLNQRLRNPKAQLDDLTFICVLTLSLAEFQQSATGGWLAHFEGAKRMVELKGGLGVISAQKPYLHSMLRYFMLTDVLSLTTSPAASIQNATRQLEHVSILEELFRDGSETCVPFPNDLFDAVIQINYLRAISAHSVSDDSSGILFATSVQTLLERILCFSVTEWAERKASEYDTGTAVTTAKPPSGFLEPVFDNWLRIAHVYHAAVVLYAVRSLTLDIPSLFLAHNPSDPASSLISAPDLHDNTRHILSRNLHLVFSSRKEEKKALGKALVWPLFVAGIEAGDHEDGVDEREFISSALLSLTTSIGSLNLRDAETFLRCYWQRNSMRGYSPLSHDRLRWDEIFTDVEGRCAFFM